jgi:hypothetical protein
VIRSNPVEKFPVEEMEREMRVRCKSLTFTHEELEDLADRRYGSRDLFGLMTIYAERFMPASLAIFRVGACRIFCDVIPRRRRGNRFAVFDHACDVQPQGFGRGSPAS